MALTPPNFQCNLSICVTVGV